MMMLLDYRRRCSKPTFWFYTTKNYFENNCGMKKQSALHNNQMYFTMESGAIGVNGCNVESDSNLRIGTIQTTQNANQSSRAPI